MPELLKWRAASFRRWAYVWSGVEQALTDELRLDGIVYHGISDVPVAGRGTDVETGPVEDDVELACVRHDDVASPVPQVAVDHFHGVHRCLLLVHAAVCLLHRDRQHAGQIADGADNLSKLSLS